MVIIFWDIKKTHSIWFPNKRVQLKALLLIVKTLEKSTLFIEWPSYLTKQFIGHLFADKLTSRILRIEIPTYKFFTSNLYSLSNKRKKPWIFSLSKIIQLSHEDILIWTASYIGIKYIKSNGNKLDIYPIIHKFYMWKNELIKI